MKNFIAIALVLTSFSAFAQTYLPAITNPQILVKTGGGLAAVQPIATLKFDYSSCRQFTFKLSKKTASTNEFSKVVNLKVVSDSDMDCFGPVTNRPYSLQITSDYNYEQFVVLNPLAATVK